MELLKKTFIILFILILLVGCSMLVSYLLPYPFSNINIIFIFLIIFMMARDSGLVVWISFFTNFFTEIYSSTPFGLILFSGTISILIIFWLYKTIFTNRSWYSAMALVSLALLLYRTLFIISLSLLKIFGLTYLTFEKTTFIIFGWELLFTCLLTGVVYFVLSKFFKSFKASPIEHGLFKI